MRELKLNNTEANGIHHPQPRRYSGSRGQCSHGARRMSLQTSHILKVCVQNIIHVLECKLEDVDATALSTALRW